MKHLKHHIPPETGLHIATETDRLNLRKSELAALHDDLQKIMTLLTQIREGVRCLK